MSITNVPGADEKNAKLSLKLRADSGYSANSDGNRVSPNQWAAILSICEESATGKALMAVPELLDALYQYRNDLRHPPAADSVERRLAMIEALLAKIGGEA